MCDYDYVTHEPYEWHETRTHTHTPTHCVRSLPALFLELRSGLMLRGASARPSTGPVLISFRYARNPSFRAVTSKRTSVSRHSVPNFRGVCFQLPFHGHSWNRTIGLGGICSDWPLTSFSRAFASAEQKYLQ